MIHLPHLIEDLGFILVTAAAVTVLFRKLKQPVVLGYLIAGFLLGPNFPFFPSIKDRASISIWAEIGVIFMLFGLGLEFSFKKLTNVGRTASIAGTFEILFMLTMGFVTGQILDWSTMDSIFLGGIISISSTTVVVRAISELGLKGRNFVSLVYGLLVVEDVIAVLLLVLLSSVAITQTLSGLDLIKSGARLIFFLVLWFLLGIYLLPVLLRRLKNVMSDETTLIISIALCLTMVMIAVRVGFSPALGAFVMGSILAETREGNRIERLLTPVKDLFSAIFFVSVGMLIDPKVIGESYGTIGLISLVTIVGKFVGVSTGSLIAGRSLRNSVQAGMSLAQIGEFSFIIATLGMTLKVTSDFLYPIAVAVSATTTFVAPYLIRSADNFYGWLDKHLPGFIRAQLSIYESSMATTQDLGLIGLFWKEYGRKIFLNSVIVIAFTITFSQFAERRDLLANIPQSGLILCLVTLVVTSPFLWAIVFGAPSVPVQGGPLRQREFGISIIRFLIGAAMTGFVIGEFTSVLAASGLGLILFAAAGAFFFSGFSAPLYKRIEDRFLVNLKEKEREEFKKREKLSSLAPWNSTLVEYTVSPNSKLIAKTLQQARIKEEYGVMIAMIERGGRLISPPSRDELILPFDKLFLIGTEEMLTKAAAVIETPFSGESNFESDDFGLTAVRLSSTSQFVEKPIRECGIREVADGLIVGLERNGEKILNPNSSMVLKPDDVIWVVGDAVKVRSLV